MYYLAEITPDDFKSGGSSSAIRNPRRYVVASVCDDKDRDSARVWKQLHAINANYQQKAAEAVFYLVKLAQVGTPLAGLLDGKALHEAHSFHSQVSKRTEKIWRYRRGDIRVLFYYGDGKIVLLTGVLVKLEDKFSKRDLTEAEKAIDAYLGACACWAVRWAE